MRVTPSALPDVLVIDPQVMGDNRGFFLETFHVARYAEHGIRAPFVQDNHSRSVRNTVRGLHLQIARPQAKLIRVVSGEIFDVAVDVRVGSPTFGQWVGVHLSAASEATLDEIARAVEPALGVRTDKVGVQRPPSWAYGATGA